MLNPKTDRKIYLEELAPPIGYKLSIAIATTYTLDLLSLLMVPLSLSLFEVEEPQEIFRDPIAVLEAIRRTTGQLTIFCQQGRISVPDSDTKLFSYLENIVYEVQPKNRNGVFHPKIWVLRFENKKDESVFYRFLCFSRNLTFDNSWDTMLKLEGKLEDKRKYAFSANHPLSNFINHLPDLTINRVDNKVKDHINTLTKEILKVRFKTPKYFEEEIEFIPSGIKGYKNQSLFKKYTRLMIISPFLSRESLKPLLNSGKENILISRGESLDQFNTDFLKKLKTNSNIYILNETAERPEKDEKMLDNGYETVNNDLSGLHTKLYLMEKGWDAHLLTGSANATNAAFNGNNVEFMVALKGKKSKIGIDPFLGSKDDETTFHDLLTEYIITEETDIEDEMKENLEEILENTRDKLLECGLNITINELNNKTYSLFIQAKNNYNEDPDHDYKLDGYCYLISHLEKNHKDIKPIFKGNSIVFSNLSLEGLTSFIAFKIKVSINQNSLSTSFVLNLPVKGMPEKRDNALLQNIIHDSDNFIRYLLFLLTDEETPTSDLLNLHRAGGDYKDFNTQSFPLLEELIKAFSRNPKKIKDIKKLVDDLCETEEGKKIIPDGFEKVWKPILAATKGKDD